jgi:hypothetical protein
MVEEGQRKLSKATKEYRKFKAKFECFSNNVACSTIWFIGLV